MIDLHAHFSSPVILASIEALEVRKHYLVRVRSSDGAEGVVTTNNRLAYLWPILEHFVIPFFLGKDVRQLPSLVEKIYTYRSVYKLAGIALWNPVAYVELAVLDMLGKIAGKSVGSLFGSVLQQEIPVYLSSLRRDTTPEEEVSWLANRLVETGASAVKLKIGGRMRRNADASPGRTEKLIPLARKVFGDDVVIYVDANGSYSADCAIKVGEFLSQYNVAFFEEPCPWQEYVETKQVSDVLEMPVAGGEQDSSLPQFKWMISNRVVDIVQPDLMYNGGMIRNLIVAQFAAKQDVSVMPHSPKAGAEASAVLQYASIVPNLGPYQEYYGEYVPPEFWYEPDFDIKNGAVPVPSGPGLGVNYDPQIWRETSILTSSEG
jgi:L-alanine-DL-glutamate epimerase-like enolase superfamily enzyme